VRRFERIVGLIAAVIVGLIALSVGTAGVDLLALPAAVLSIVAVGTVGLFLILRYVVVSLLAPAAGVIARLSVKAWPAVADDPAVVKIHGISRRAARRLRWLRPAARWLGGRLRPTPSGLGLTAAVVLTMGAVLALWRVGSWVVDPASSAVGFDVRFVDMATRLGEGSSHTLMSALSAAGRTAPVAVMVVLLAGGAWLAGSRRGAILIVSTSFVSSLGVTLLKALIHRGRPAFGSIVETSASWPSGHSAAALALALGLTYVWWRLGRRHWYIVAAITVPVGLLVGYSRAALTVHWATDVLGGWLVAIIAFGLVASIDLAIPWRRAEPLRHLRGGKTREAGGSVLGTAPPAPRYLVWSAAAAAAIATVVGLVAAPLPPPQGATLALTQLDSSDIQAVLGNTDLYTTTLLGRRMEPVGVIVIGDRSQLEAATAEAGWTIAAELSSGRLLRTYLIGIRGGSDAGAPVTPSFLAERMQDFAIQRPVSASRPDVRARHHARFWALPVRLSDGCPVWVATASLDDRVEWNFRTVLPNHHIDPAIDVERDLLASDLTGTGRFSNQGLIPSSPPTLGTNAAGDPFFTDGGAAVLHQTGACS
jgi:hypothetical protein